jgi:hypothetical protein
VSQYIDELKAVIRHCHGVESEHVESVPIKEIYQGKTVWDGVVEVFNLKNHPTAERVYAWSYDTDNPNEGPHHVTVLHIHPIRSARDAVRAAIVEEFRSGAAEEV